MSDINKPKLLIVDDDLPLLSSWQRALNRDFEVLPASNVDEAFHLFQSKPDLALIDIRLNEEEPENQQGVELLDRFLESRPDMPIVMTSAYGDIEIAVECMRRGAFDFFKKPSDLKEIRQRLYSALQHGKEKRKARHFDEYIKQSEPVEIIGESPQIQELKGVIDIVAQDGRISVLIRGETGTGKDLIAKSIYRSGIRYGEPYVVVPIVSMPNTLIESELFGHEKGAFTDAKGRKIGWLEKADGGILFLDEIGDLPFELQIKLLRFLEEREFTRVGSTSPIKVDVQVISATNQDLEKFIEEGKFREDLYYRLKGVQIQIPPLRERKEDIPLLVSYFLKQFHKDVQEISSEALDALLNFEWPGNIRELKVCIERAVLFAKGRGHVRIEIEDLPNEVVNQEKNSSGTLKVEFNERINLAESLARYELAHIEEALRKAKGKKSLAWQILELNDRFSLLRRVKSIHRKYPFLLKEFPLISKAFKF